MLGSNVFTNIMYIDVKLIKITETTATRFTCQT